MSDAQTMKIAEEIKAAFSALSFPGIDRAISSGNHDEHVAMRREFGKLTDWRLIPYDILDSAPDGFACALSFLSPLGFQFYIPAYMIADLAGRLGLVNPTFFLCVHATELSTPDGIKFESNLNAMFPKEANDRIGIFNSKQCCAISNYCSQMSSVRNDPCLVECSNYWKLQSLSRG